MTRPLRNLTLTLALALTLALVAFALAQGGMGHGATGTPGGHGGMAHGAGMRGPADEASFLAHMIPHHQEAIDSAEALLEVTERPELQSLLRDIITSQTAEIELMTQWLARWHPDAPATVPYTPMMRDRADAPVAEQERAFLEDMLMHHMMAVRDARMLLAQGLAEHEEVADLARSIVTEQTREMSLMQDWLAAWFDAPGTGMGMMGSMRPPGMAEQGPMGMMHGGGMGGMGGVGGMGPMGMMHGSGTAGMGMMAGQAASFLDAGMARALANAFLAGAGEGGEVTEVLGPRITYEVAFRNGDVEGLLLVDARTGEVWLAPDR